MVRGVVEWFNFIYTWMIYCFTVYIVYLSMLEQATFLSLKLEFENMVMSMLIGNPANEIHLKDVKISQYGPGGSSEEIAALSEISWHHH